MKRLIMYHDAARKLLEEASDEEEEEGDAQASV
jgi:hypothetical protein